MSKTEDFEDLPYENEKMYTPKEVEEFMKKEKNKLLEEFNCTVSQIQEECQKLIKEENIKKAEKINRLESENRFYINIIKAILHI